MIQLFYYYAGQNKQSQKKCTIVRAVTEGAKSSFGPVVPPIDHLRTRVWPRTGHYPFLFSLSIIRTTTPAARFTYILCVCMCMLISVID